MKSSFVISLLLGMFEMNVSLIREYIYVNKPMKLTEAMITCKKNYTDLASVTTTEENSRLVATLGGANVYGYIGLYRTYQTPYIWKWTDRDPSTFTSWFTGQPTLNAEELCVNAGPLGWNDRDCSDGTFFCYRRWYQVNEKMTWDDAHDFCKHNYTNLSGPSSEVHLDYLANLLNVENQVVVWSGLRFRDGFWLWLNGTRVENIDSLPQCPATQYDCGALNVYLRSWENRDCNEKLLFFCN